MKWKMRYNEQTIVDKKGIVKKIQIPLDEQEDTVGNIYQKGGGVIPKACQECGKEFKAEPKKIPIEEEVPTYKCEKCDFNNASADLAWDHEKANKGHKIKKDRRKRIVGFNIIQQGIIPRIKKTKKDVIILCDNCNDQ